MNADRAENGLTAKQLNWYNPQAARLKNGNLHAGQRILVPRLDVVAPARDVPDPKIERYPLAPAAASGAYVVKRGDSLAASPAQRHERDGARRLNGSRRRRPYGGRRLRVQYALQRAKSAPKAAAAESEHDEGGGEEAGHEDAGDRRSQR